MDPKVAQQCQRRRTFAIISHPDAGKTTLTEKLLLYSGMIRTAGMVRGRKGSKAASSDWMSLEQERGISITASAMQFPYKDVIINVLDTPGHQDFSEDTYRTLTAADSAVMVIDAAKGVETQTRKLFQVCRMRNIPILTFVNKMDLPGREPLELLQEVEEVLSIKAAPMNWPIGSGPEFAGLTNCATKNTLLFEKRSVGGAEKAGVQQIPFSELNSVPSLTPRVREQLETDLELLEIAGNPFTPEAFLRGEVTPVFFGSALTNFGVEEFFDNFARLAPPPRGYTVFGKDGAEMLIDPAEEPFSGFIFKIQANMNPRHRDSVAFFRVGSGQFEREMGVWHHRLGKEIRLSRSHSMFAQDRNLVEVAYPGDIVGVINPGVFEIGDTISLTRGIRYRSLPQFPPEVFAQIRPVDISKRKSFDKGMKQLASEGTMQVLYPLGKVNPEPIVAAVGVLQFEVLQYRLKDEYGVDTRLESLPQQSSAWLVGDPKTFQKTTSSVVAEDPQGRVIVLFSNTWERNYSLEKNPNHRFEDFSST